VPSGLTNSRMRAAARLQEAMGRQFELGVLLL
jgi:hypothetical protein